jgi:hypothetical protein
VNLVASPNNNNEGCPDGYYNSVILARSGCAPHLPSNDIILAFNEPLSQSGWAAPVSVGIVGKSRLQTGGHAAMNHTDRQSFANKLDRWIAKQQKHPISQPSKQANL